MAESTVFVTVGTTKFDLLIKTLCQPEVLSLLEYMKYTRILMQIGKGEYIPKIEDKKIGITLEYYTLKKSIAADMQQASLVISHAGAGSIFESLNAKKQLLVVVNEMLMDNHQLELAQHLAKEGYLIYTTCEYLKETLAGIDFSNLKPYVPGNPKGITDYLDKQFGFK
ncbi:Bifunctional UDP-N-acetylglucosamine transferase and deubiquitinase ALG13 [Oopsacas minuta]|uniref:UDP-N-acetylglucosamine transferase subunit ALG13 n=1 Tax=Oopsacas minuta TaxID=111878 RepID=A0AAV7JS07_9METZ|nr:Bifunctional UDP-N-acetylglucosamine transferase and deubiquitinase ALG13 [Oopsacas minuta]